MQTKPTIPADRQIPTSAHLSNTPLLDYRDPAIQRLIDERGWHEIATLSSQNETERIYHQIGAVYNFVRDEVAFGYNESDTVPASHVLSDGYGQCNTKATLFMALLRALDIPCRFRGLTIYKALQKGAIRGIWYVIAPDEIIHSWVEVYYDRRWLALEGLILDRTYLEAVQQKFGDTSGSFCGYGIATKDLRNPAIDWTGSETCIQKDGIARDFGTFESPDDFYARHGANLNGIKAWLYRNWIRHLINRNVNQIRSRRRA